MFDLVAYAIQSLSFFVREICYNIKTYAPLLRYPDVFFLPHEFDYEYFMICFHDFCKNSVQISTDQINFFVIDEILI